MEDFHYLYLSESNYLKFDPVNQITNVFFDECRQMIFIVKSAVVSVKSVSSKNGNFSFQLDNQNPLIAIKFCAENSILAVQRSENILELIGFKNNQIVPNLSILYESKKQGKIPFYKSDYH